ncbi:MAG: glycoside hydrolase family 95 protein [Clostridia bacterium]|nr:glycoside hydrolase family 95 protein [Clostridia bacterium]
MSTKLFYNQFVNDWMHALPLGNGRIGAMVYGNPAREVIEINEESLWSGRQIKEQNHATPEALAQIRKHISDEQLQEASDLSKQTFLSHPARVRFYESFGEIFLDFPDKTGYTEYRKELELKDAVASFAWKKGNTSYHSESFVSEKYDLFIYRITADAPFSCNVTIKREQDAYTAATSEDTLHLNGRVTWFDENDYGKGGEGLTFGAQLKIESDGNKKANHDSLSVEGATVLTVYAAFATNYNVKLYDVDETIDVRGKLNACIDGISNHTYEEIKKSHLKDHAASYSAVELKLNAPNQSEVSVTDRLRAIKKGGTDPDLCVLYYNFGRYLLTESSGKNSTLPANLQGIWSHGFRPAWGADYHTNINVQMNYWPAEAGNSSDTVSSLTHFVKMLSKFGESTAKELFFSEGWAINHTTDIFGRTGIHDHVGCGFFPMAGPWMCLSLWEHYEYTDDVEYLNEIWPILEGSCRFVCGYLTEEEDGSLVTSPSNSPENWFWYNHPDGTRKKQTLTKGATFDFEIIYALFTRVKYACTFLGKDPSFGKKLQSVLDRLPPLRISQRYGTICEWIKDYEEVEPGHRHISHLFGLYPADQINETDPAIYEAAKKTIARRLSHGGGHTGWSRAWTVNFYARFKEGDQALHHLYQLFATNTEANLFDLHPPHIFQIDGNLGATAGINEMLIQSHLGTPGHRITELIPALPAEWKEGSVKGLKARGNFTFDFAWSEGQLTEVTVTAGNDGELRWKLPDGAVPQSDGEYTLSKSVLSRTMRAGEQATFRFE